MPRAREHGLGRRAMRATILGSALVVAVSMGTAYGAIPSTATTISVTASNVTSNVDGHLHPAGSISGKITAATGGGALSAIVSVYRSGSFVSSTFAPASGVYTVGALPAATNYKVCVSGTGVISGGSSTTGYLGRCWKSAAWNGGTIPSTATSVNVTQGNTTPNINIKLASAAAIAGKVTSPSGAAINNVFVNLHNRSKGTNFFAFTNSKGQYTAKSLTASAKGYSVCFNPFGVTVGTGFLPRCYKNKAWSGVGFPSTATVVSVALGHTHSKVNQTLPKGGAISGTVKSSSNGAPIASDNVIVFNSKGTKFLGSALTNAKGQYKVRGLPAATSDRVCAAPTTRSTATTQTTFHGKCWKGIAYNGTKFPSGTKAVSVHTGSTHSGISFSLSKTVTHLGSIAGNITEFAGGHALQFATVSLFTSSGGSVGVTSTDSSGHYKFSGLHPSATGYVVCATAWNSAFSTTPTPATGWDPRCYTSTTGTPWSGGSIPSAAKRLSLTAGQNRTGINIALRVGGAIAGTVYQGAGTSTPVNGVTVDLYTASHRFLRSTFSGATGTGGFTFTGLNPAANAYIVCYDGRFATPSLLPQCFDQKAWNGTA